MKCTKSKAHSGYYPQTKPLEKISFCAMCKNLKKRLDNCLWLCYTVITTKQPNTNNQTAEAGKSTR